MARCTLAQLKSEGIIEELEISSSSSKRLQSLGLFEGQHVELARRGNPLIVKAAGSRIAIAESLAKAIFIREPE